MNISSPSPPVNGPLNETTERPLARVSMDLGANSWVLPDTIAEGQVNPSADTHRLMGERFAKLAFASGGVFGS